MIILNTCSKDQVPGPETGFTLLEPMASGIGFSNNIIENDTLNYFTFPFLYLGGGVSIGDINNDDLPDVFFTGNQVPNRLYLNRGNLQFEDIAVSAGVNGDDRWYAGSTMVDINQDGWLDIYVSVAGKFGNTANQLFINRGDNTFSEEAAAYGIADESTSIQSSFFDYNNDGLLDLFVANYPVVRVSGGNRYYRDKMDANRPEDSGHLYRNDGNGTFTDVTEAAHLRRFGLTLGLVAADFNNDGFQDLYLSNDFNVPDYFYQNNGDGTFTEVSQQALRHTAMFGMGIDAADFNNDGRIDLLQLDMTAEDHKRSKTNMASMRPEVFYEAVDIGLHYQYMQNCLQLNHAVTPQGLPLFSDISRLAGLATTDWSWGAIFADLNNDGWKDAVITNGIKRDVNNNDVNLQYEEATFWGRATHPDHKLMPSTPISNYAFLNKGDFTFSNVTNNWGLDKKGFSNGFACADLDNDGDLDIVINNLDAPASLYRNNTPSEDAHYLKIKLRGPAQNPFGLGTRVQIKTGRVEQVQELTLTRGYQSSVPPVIHFGLGEANLVDELKILWPDGKQQVVRDLSVDRTMELVYQSSLIKINTPSDNRKPFRDITPTSQINFEHREDDFDDFAREPLLPHRTSRYGPGVAVADINADGLDDFFVGNAKGRKAVLYIQNDQEKFDVLPGPWEEDEEYEDTGALFFDADQDGDPDLYIVSGGNDASQSPSLYQDRLYINTSGRFVKARNALPPMHTSGQAVATYDFDRDGDEDLFVGGRIVPGRYPHPPKSYLLRNDGADGRVKFSDVTSEVAPALTAPGLVTSAIWDDFNADGWADLIIAGEWMPIRFIQNNAGRFEEITDKTGLSNLEGWWYSLAKADFDQDGDMDYIAGNLGLNYKYKASPRQPFEVYANDFDENGSQDIVLSYQKGKKLLPVRGRECSSQQVPAIKVRFTTYEAFADASLQEIYGRSVLGQSLHYQAKTFAHQWIENKGNGIFVKYPLPHMAQFSSINSIEVFDYNQDTYPDLLLAGNLYHAEVETPRGDASLGLILTTNPDGGFKAVPPGRSGLMLTGEMRSIQHLQVGRVKTTAFLFARNDDPLLLLKFDQ